METHDTHPGRRKQRLPPRRGEVKARIFKGIAEGISRAIGNLLTADTASVVVPSTDSDSPPPSGHTSD
ncbi:hypothetical protein MLD38_011623 [Melastoma candidum]|uniref:Uncharacterized protein n=1 Tax=Melastoma candidum TaxID=119954 RepID=A0ACB9R773_9MYRT|nr:hypothetical protein MLD38_011623 [Melastoma candidum]